MSDAYKGLIVTLDADYGEDNAQFIIEAIKMIKGVLDASPVIVDFEDLMNRRRIEFEIRKKLYEVLDEV